MSDPVSRNLNEDWNRTDKRWKPRECVSAVFGDPLLRVSVPDVVRKHSAEVHAGTTVFEERVRSLSAKSNEAVETGNEEQARE
jgi:hypothetical protein